MGFNIFSQLSQFGGVTGVLMIMFVAFGGLMFGYDTGTISGILAMKHWIALFATETDESGDPVITASQQALIVSALSIGTFFGALSGAPFADYIGRRLGLVVACAVFAAGAAMQTAATAIPLFSAGRAIAGAGVGLISALIPLYQAETAPRQVRGFLIGSYQLFVTLGLLLAAIVNNATHQRDDTGSYRIPCAVQVAFAIVLSAGMLWLPETPRYYVKSNKLEHARNSLHRLRRLPKNDPRIDVELDAIIANRDAELQVEGGSWADCFSTRNHNVYRLITGCAVMGLSQLAGVNFIFYFGTQFFQQAGINNAFTITLITNLVNVLSTIPGLYLVEKWGRRPILLFGAIGMTVCEFVVGAVGLSTNSGAANNALIAFVCFYIFFFASSWGPVGWTVVAEIFPLQLRAKAVSMSIATIWLFNWAIAYATPYLVGTGPGDANMGYKVFFIWGTCCFIAVLFTYFCVYETKNLTLEQVDELYAVCHRAWKSPSIRSRLAAAASADGNNDEDGTADTNDSFSGSHHHHHANKHPVIEHQEKL